MPRPKVCKILVVCSLAFSVTSGAVAAQSADSSDQRTPPFSTGISAGVMRFSGGRSQQILSAILQYQPTTWLTFSVTPGYARSSLRDSSSTGLTDIPFSAGASHEFDDVPWSPSLSASLSATATPGGSSAGGGLGHGAFGAYAAVGASPTDRWSVDVGMSQPLSATSGNGSIEIESSLTITRATLSLGFSAELGSADSGAVLARSAAAGLSFPLVGRLSLTVDGTRGLTSGAPAWTLSVGIGTAFAGHSPLSPTSVLRRVTKVLGGNVRSTSGRGRLGACKKNGTC